MFRVVDAVVRNRPLSPGSAVILAMFTVLVGDRRGRGSVAAADPRRRVGAGPPSGRADPRRDIPGRLPAMSILVVDVGTSGVRAAVVRPDATVEHVASA